MNVTAKTITVLGDGWIAITADLSAAAGAEFADHIVLLRPEAIANRMVGYGLATADEALDAILREHSLRLSTLDPKSDAHVDQLGGLDDRFTVSTAKTADTAALFAEPALADLIQEATATVDEQAADPPIDPVTP